jgi:hypothetical protein
MLAFERGPVKAVASALGVAALAWAVTNGFDIYMPGGIFNLRF